MSSPSPANRPSPAHTIWLRRKQAAFVYLPKVACTSWKLFLGQALGLAERTAITYANVHDGAALALPYLSSFSAEEQEAFNAELDQGAITLFTVMREPRERALSAYLDKILLHKNPSSYFSLEVLPSIRTFHGLDSNKMPDFAQFLAWIQAQKSHHCQNDHWCPMSDLLGIHQSGDGTGQPARHWQIWPMNAMDEAAASIGTLLNYSGPFPSREALGERPNRNSSNHLRDYRTPEVDPLLNLIYQDDLTLYASITQSQPKP